MKGVRAFFLEIRVGYNDGGEIPWQKMRNCIRYVIPWRM
jgi:hypothetical protein